MRLSAWMACDTGVSLFKDGPGVDCNSLRKIQVDVEDAAPSIYSHHPGSREKGATSEGAAKQTAPLANARRAELFAKFLEASDHGLTADEAIDAVEGICRTASPGREVQWPPV